VTAENTHMIRQEITQLGEDPELFLQDDFEQRVSNTDLLNASGRNIYTVIANVDGKATLLEGITHKEWLAIKAEDPTAERIETYTQNKPFEGLQKKGAEETRRWAVNSSNGYDISVKGDKRFTANNAFLKNGKSIAELFVKHKKLSAEERYQKLKELWAQYLDENPKLFKDLLEKTKGKTIILPTAKGPVNTARALSDLIREKTTPQEDKVRGSKVVEVQFWEEKDKAWGDKHWMAYSELLEMRKSKKVKFKETGKERILPHDSLVLAKWENTDIIGMLANEAKTNADEQSMAELLSEYAEKAFKQNYLSNPELLDKAAKQYEKYGITKADLADAFVTHGNNQHAINAYISARMQEHFDAKADALFANMKKEGSEKNVEEYIKMHLTDEGAAAYDAYKDGKTSGISAEELSYFQSLKYLEDRLNPVSEDLRRKAKYDADERVKRSKENERKLFEKQASIPVVEKHAAGLDMYPEDIFIPDEGYDKGNAPFVAGRLRSATAQKLYEKLAAVFGAELLVVNHDPSHGKRYKSRYVPEGTNGKPQIIINISEPVKFSSIFAHELFHHVVNLSSKEEYAAFTEALSKLGSPKIKESIRTDAERKYEAELLLKNEEIQAELFADLIYDKNFYNVLSETLAGKGLAAKLLSRLLKLITKLHDFFHGKKREWTYEFDARISQQDMQKAQELVADLIGHAINRESLQHGDERYHTPLGDMTAKEADELAKNKENWLGGIYKKIFPKGSKKFQNMMTLMEGYIKKIPKWIKETKPKSIFADFLVDKQIAYYAMLVQNQPNYRKTLFRKRIVNPNKEVFNEYINYRQGLIDEELTNGTYEYMGKTLHPERDAELIEELRLKLPNLVLEELYDDFVRGEIDVTTEEGMKKAIKLGYTGDIIGVLTHFKEVADELYKELKKVQPDLPYNPTHYCMSLKWYAGNSKVYNAFDAAVQDEFTQFELSKKLGGPEQFLKARNLDMTTAEIAKEYGIGYKTIDPFQMAEEYVADAQRLINIKKMLIDGIKKGYVKIYRGDKEAEDDSGMLPLNDDVSRIMMDMTGEFGYQIRLEDGQVLKMRGKPATYSTIEEANAAARDYENKTSRVATVSQVDMASPAKVSYYAVFEMEKVIEEGLDENDDIPVMAKGRELARFETKAEAKAYAKAVKEETTIEPVTSLIKKAEVARYYFHPDLQNMLNVTLKEDKFRNGSAFGVSGNFLLNVKNTFTAWQFAFSTFHMFTIMQELISSYATWAQMKKNKNIFGRFNLRAAYAESRELALLLDAVLINKDYADDPAINKRASELLGVNSIDILDTLEVLFHSGGILEQDPTLRSSIHNLAEQKYTKGESKVTVEDGKYKLHIAPLSVKETVGSIKQAFENAAAKHPNNKPLAALKATGFASFETTTAWIMEGMIPKVKLAMWVREYTMNLEKHAADIESGKTTKEEIGRMTMKFIEDRFGEVNWKNMWLDPTIKSLLQFFFRSFTWRSGSWKAITKANLDLGKKAWFTIKGEKYELTEHGLWGMNALLAHFLTVGFLTAAYQAVVLGTGQEVPDDEETPLLTRVLFPRNNRFDPYARVSVPSYVTEFYKILQHLGTFGGPIEPHKILSGGLNSLVVNTYEALVTGEDWRGVSIRDADDNAVFQMVETITHIVGILPISFSTIRSNYKQKGLDLNSTVMATLGMTDAPAAAKRSRATNIAFAHRRKEFRGRAVSSDEMKLKDNIKRAAYLYGKGNKKPLLDMLHDGRITRQKFKNALERVPRINGKKNPSYKTPLYVAIKGLTINSALDVWNEMSDNEKKKHRGQIIKKYRNVLKRKDRTRAEKNAIRDEMKELGIL